MDKPLIHGQMEEVFSDVMRSLLIPRGLHVDPKELRARLLVRARGESSPYIEALVAVASTGIQNEIRKIRWPAEWDEKRSGWISQLVRKANIDGHYAAWAVERWAYELQVISESQLLTKVSSVVESASSRRASKNFLSSMAEWWREIYSATCRLGINPLALVLCGIIAFLLFRQFHPVSAVRIIEHPSSQSTWSPGWWENLNPSVPPISSWQQGTAMASKGLWSGATKIPWFHFTIRRDEVARKLESLGLKVVSIRAVALEEAYSDTVFTYEIKARITQPLYRINKVSWGPFHPRLIPLSRVLIFADGLGPGEELAPLSKVLVNPVDSDVTFVWNLKYELKGKTVTYDQLPFDRGLYTDPQISGFIAQAAVTEAGVRDIWSRIEQRVQEKRQSLFASIPSDPPQPATLSSQFGGSGSGEPTRTAVRSLGGAGGGAAIGGLADGGEGAGYGAAAGFLGGLLYDIISKANDKKNEQAAVSAENARRQQNWRDEKITLARRRAAAEKAVDEEESVLAEQLVQQVSANQGHLPKD